MASRFHHFRQARLTPPIRPRVRLHWLNGHEWRGVLLVMGRHEFGLRIGRKQ